jgi:predicted DNA binding CopG/RHH family protein
MNTKTKPMPSLRSDAEAEKFVDTADLSKFDLSGFKPMRFEIEPKSAALHLRLPESLLEELKNRAKDKGVPYTRYVRMLLESDLAKPS